MSTKAVTFIFLILVADCASAQTLNYPKDFFVSPGIDSPEKQSHSYDPLQLGRLSTTHHNLDLEMFDLINEAAYRHDPAFRHGVGLLGDEIGYIPSLAVAYYKWAFGDKSQLDWLLKMDRMYGDGYDNSTITVFGYMDEWDRTIRALKRRYVYLSKGEGASTGELVDQAILVRKALYGAERFDRAWKQADVR